MSRAHELLKEIDIKYLPRYCTQGRLMSGILSFEVGAKQKKSNILNNLKTEKAF
ncbi:hypothetical protein Glove_768g7 [Diversispora epigaea]|uniref:Uncharacterized protein n=1 Tax=Diversispora epigaea TaxID=1348612 RepID=A0A397G1V6_9GLOM|nr:hypothetical protein Glove_768g7 [Diversispora epigaea]